MTKARVNADNASADIQGVTAGTGLTGGGTSGTVTLTNDMATVIDAKGDLVVGTGADTYDNLAAGSNGETLVADSSTSTGLRYQGSMAAGRNGVINGGMDIWQRGTSIALGNFSQYVSDRWMMNYSGKNTGLTTSRQVTGDTTNLPFIQYCARVQRNSGETSTAAIQYVQSMETSQSLPFAGKTITLSFYARAGANYSSASNAFSAIVFGGTGTDQNTLAGYTGNTTILSQTATLTTTWQRFSYSAAVGSTITELAPFFQYVPSGTAGANDYFEITGVQLEVGSVATQFTRAGGTIQGELAACQRYFYKYNASATTGPFGPGNYFSSTLFITALPMKQTMRITPVLTFNNPTSFTVFSNSGSRAATAITTDTGNPDIVSISVTTSAATAGNAGAMNAASSNASIEFNSEL